MKRKILIFEKQGFAKFFSTFLVHMLGRKVIIARSVDGAKVALAQERGVDLVLSNYSWPDDEGADVIKYVHDVYPKIKTVLLSADAKAPRIAEITGADGYIDMYHCGPIELKELFEQLGLALPQV